ncbi:pyridoxal phosphate-dependent decarboxylase family protein [Ponticaulis profundi]|uniref:Pyridoxal phosphate-dependent decarboxylase family protein n=1 Tax=Ponticaulis profundi TaxID=2665222 RepID=A0ABW1S5F8_9PROT
MTFPENGRSADEILSELDARSSQDVQWRDGKTAVYIFNAGEDISALKKQAYTAFIEENGLGPLAFPSLRQMEEDVIAMALDILHGGEGATGKMTSGGTDSITMAMKTARDYARAEKGVSGPLNIVLPYSAHLAFDKAAHLMDIEVRRIPVEEGAFTADVTAMADACDAHTIMVVGSAPNFPYGIIDPIEALSEMCEAKDLWLHVDACVGGFLAPFVRMNGAEIPPFDFEVPGVHSMSADLHKYGYCAKGASTVLFRSEALYQYMPFDFDNWSGTQMVTPTLAGTRPGGAISAAWAVMNHLGIAGYCEKQALVTKARAQIEAGLRQLGFEILGEPKLGLMAFHHPDFHAYALWGKMAEKGWFTSLTKDPPSLHLMLSPKHAEVANVYLADLEKSMTEITPDTEHVKARYS